MRAQHPLSCPGISDRLASIKDAVEEPCSMNDPQAPLSLIYVWRGGSEGFYNIMLIGASRTEESKHSRLATACPSSPVCIHARQLSSRQVSLIDFGIEIQPFDRTDTKPYHNNPPNRAHGLSFALHRSTIGSRTHLGNIRTSSVTLMGQENQYFIIP